MITRILAVLAAFMLCGFFVVNGEGQRPQNDTVTLTRGTCVSDDSNATTYNSAGFQALGTGLTETDTALIVVGVMAEDNAATFGIASMTINGIAASEIVDEDGTGTVDAALYQLPIEIGNAATVNVSVTASEALAGSMTVCAWGLKNLRTLTPTSSIQDDDTASGALVLTLGTTTSGGFAVGICGSTGVSDSTTWAVLSEQQDTQSGEHDFSNADAATTGASMSVTCDWAGNTLDATGAAAAFR